MSVTVSIGRLAPSAIHGCLCSACPLAVSFRPSVGRRSSLSWFGRPRLCTGRLYLGPSFGLNFSTVWLADCRTVCPVVTVRPLSSECLWLGRLFLSFGRLSVCPPPSVVAVHRSSSSSAVSHHLCSPNVSVWLSDDFRSKCHLNSCNTTNAHLHSGHGHGIFLFWPAFRDGSAVARE